MLDQLNIEAIEFSVSADTKMLLLLCGKSLGKPKHNCPFCDATEPFHGDHNLYTIGDLFDWHEKYVKDGAKRNVHSGEKQAGEADLEGNQARDFLKCLDKLEEGITRVNSADQAKGLAFVQTLRAFKQVVHDCFSIKLQPSYKTSINHFSKLYRDLGISVTPKVHMVERHIVDFF